VILHIQKFTDVMRIENKWVHFAARDVKVT